MPQTLPEGVVAGMLKSPWASNYAMASRAFGRRRFRPAIAPECEHEHVGIRPGEKLNEVLLSEDEARHAVEMEHMFVVRPESTWQQDGHWNHGASLPEGFRYASDTNGEWLQVEELRHMAEQMVHN